MTDTKYSPAVEAVRNLVERKRREVADAIANVERAQAALRAAEEALHAAETVERRGGP